MSEPAAPTVVGRYVLHAPIARGGMASIHLARLLGAEGFSRLVAAKRLHPQFTDDAEFLAMFLDEARIASKVHHPNVVPVIDVVHTGAEVILVQEYVHGLPLDKLLRAARDAKIALPIGVVVAVVADMLAGIDAAHEARDELGVSLDIVHRDVSPQNVMIGVDGIARILDFGVAKATLNAHVTQAGTFKGKLAYTSPEQMKGTVTRAADLYAAAVVLWEALAGRRRHLGRSEAEICAAVAAGTVERLTEVIDPASVLPERWAALVRLDRVVTRGLALAPEDRWATAREMREALLAATPAASSAEVSRWVKQLGKAYLEGREKLIVSEESTWRQRASAVPDGASGDAPSQQAPEPSTSGASLRPSVLPVTELRRAEWALLAALLLIAGLLASILGLLLRDPAAPSVLAAPALTPALDAPVEAPPAPPMPPTPPTADTATPPAPPLRASAPARDPRLAPRPALSARSADCDPTFSFDGKKKVFMPGCL